MKLTIPKVIKAAAIRVNGGKSVPRITIEKGANRIRFNKAAIELLNLSSDDCVQIGFNESEENWYIFKDKHGERVRDLPIKKEGKVDDTALSNIVLSPTFCKLLRNYFNIQDSGGVTLRIADAISDNEGKFYQLFR